MMRLLFYLKGLLVFSKWWASSVSCGSNPHEYWLRMYYKQSVLYYSVLKAGDFMGLNWENL